MTENVDKEEEGVESRLSVGAEQVLMYAESYAENSSDETVRLVHLLKGICSLKESYAVYYMQKQSVDETLADANPLIGREDELERTIQILCRKDKNNPLHIGESGVGKTAVTYGLVQRIKDGNVPEQLIGCKVFELDMGSLLAGTQYRGDFEKRFKSVIEGILREEKPIIYLDEIHNIVGAGAVGESSFDNTHILFFLCEFEVEIVVSGSTITAKYNVVGAFLIDFYSIDVFALYQIQFNRL